MNPVESRLAETMVNVGRFCRINSIRAEENGFMRLDLRKLHEDTINDRLVFLPSFLEAVSDVIDRHIDKKKLEKALEVGCGTGFFSRYLAPLWLKEKLTSFDVNLLSLQTLKEKEKTVNVFQGSIYSLPIQSESMDVVIGYSSFDSFTWLSQALNEAKRVLKPGGKIILFQDIATQLYETDGKTLEDKKASFERYHEALVRKAKEAGVEILEGEKDYLRISNVEQMSKIRERVPEFELPDRHFPLMAIWDKGWIKPPITRQTRELAKISKEDLIREVDKICEQFQNEGAFKESNAKPGDLVTLLKMRFLVGKKPIAS